MLMTLLDSAWRAGLEPMTKEEAAFVWRKVWEMSELFPDGRRLISLFETLEKERWAGQRCSVCGRHASEDYDCAREC